MSDAIDLSQWFDAGMAGGTLLFLAAGLLIAWYSARGE